jgi:hypothetical protein
MGCIDLRGRCQPGTADNKCGLSGGTCVDCTGLSAAPVCDPAGECVAGSPGGGDAGPDAGSAEAASDGAPASDDAASDSAASDAGGD